MMEFKGCPLLVQSDTNPSCTVSGKSWTRTYFLRCIGEKCAAYKTQNAFCEKFQVCVLVPDNMSGDE